MKAFVTCALVAAALVVAQQHNAAPAPAANRGSVYDTINTPAFAAGAKAFYLQKIAGNEGRAKLMAQAKEECAGRYEGTALSLVELSHAIDADKHPSNGGKTFTVAFETHANVRWLAVETIACSVHGGHDQSLLHAVLISGNETQTVTYRVVNDKEAGKPAVSDVKRVYAIEADELTDQVRTPYAEQ